MGRDQLALLRRQPVEAAGELAQLVQTIRDAGVKAIFAESSVNPKVEQAVADEADARAGRCGPTRSGRAAPTARPT